MRPFRKKRELANWIKRRLGAPLIDVLIDATQLDDVIDEATDYFGEFAGGIGNEDMLLFIKPECLYYDGYTIGKWRKLVTQLPDVQPKCPVVTPGTTGTTGCVLTCPPTFNNAQPYEDFQYIETTNCSGDELCVPGITAASGSPCYWIPTTENDPCAYGPFWMPGDTSFEPQRFGWLTKSIYDVPSSVNAVYDVLDDSKFSLGIGTDSSEALFSPTHLLLHGGGSWGAQNSTSWVDNRYGYWQGSNGGFVDIIGWEIGMQYLEMYRTLYSVKYQVQLLDLQHKVRISPAPRRGQIVIACSMRMADEYMYEHQWVRKYATALAMIQIGMNSAKYTNLSFPGGSSINSDLYLQRGDTLKAELEQELLDGKYAEPPEPFFFG